MPLAMPPAMTDLLDIWAAHSPLAGHAPDQITVDFLLPTGIYIQMDVPREATIQHIKLVSGSGWVRSGLEWDFKEIWSSYMTVPANTAEN